MNFAQLLGVRSLVVGLVLMAGALAPGVAGAQDVRVIDGDTLQIGSAIVQLDGIDAPELGQICLNGRTPYNCGQEAAAALRKLVGVTAPTCSFRSDGDAPGTAVCMSSNRDLSLLMVQQGYAVAVPGAQPAYTGAQAEAKNARLGIWRGDFISFDDWRAGKRLSAESEADPAKACPIIGISHADGRQIYYVPNDTEYSDIGGRRNFDGLRFCSDEEAREAGFVRPGQS